jgi:hypothetical protein
MLLHASGKFQTRQAVAKTGIVLDKMGIDKQSSYPVALENQRVHA